ncbi:MAG: class I SAM-dependent methyltransferase [Lautropia sp.]
MAANIEATAKPARAVPVGAEVLTDDELFEMNVHQGFLAAARGYWRTAVYRAVIAEAREVASPDTPVDEIESRMAGRPAYFLYAWLERHLQQARYGGRGGVMTVARQHRDALGSLFPAGGKGDTAAPAHIRALDIHQHPGGLSAAIENAVAHEWYHCGPSFSGVGTEGMVDFYVASVSKLLPRGGSVVDVGCTLGRMTLALKKALPGARVTGVDVCEPVIRVAREKARRLGLAVDFRVADAADMPFPDASFDVVASHWLFHELPAALRERAVDEAYRLTRPGGHVVIFDMYRCPGGNLALWLQKGFSVRNNEPFSIGFSNMDLKAALERRGFRDVSVSDFNPDDNSVGTATALPPARTHFTTLVCAQRPPAS